MLAQMESIYATASLRLIFLISLEACSVARLTLQLGDYCSRSHSCPRLHGGHRIDETFPIREGSRFEKDAPFWVVSRRLRGSQKAAMIIAKALPRLETGARPLAA